MAEECILVPGSGGGLDQDTSEYSPLEEFSKGSYRYALNLRVGNTSKNQTDSGENIPSTLLINNYNVWNGSAWISGSAQAGTNIVQGKYEDRSAGIVYWAVKNSNGHHAILYFVKSERKIYELLQWDGLNFNGNFVSMTKINKYLILTDGNPADGTGNPPRMMDVTTIYVLKSTLGGNFGEYHISFSKWLPVMPPIIDNAGQANGNVFIKKGIYQFAYRYIYIGGFRSCWSPPSNFVSNELLVVHNTGQQNPLVGQWLNFGVNTPGWVFDYNTPANTSFGHTDARFYKFIASIEYAFRESQTAQWKLFSRVNVNGSAPSTDITFANSGQISTVAPNDIGQYFDSVPLLSRSVEAIDNRPMFGNNLDDLAPLANFDVTNIAVYSAQPVVANTPTDTWFDVGALATSFQIQRFSFKENGIYKLGIIFKHYDGRSGLVQTLDKWTYSIPIDTTLDVPPSQEEFHALGFKIANGVVPPIWAVDYQIVRSNCLNIDFFLVGQVNDFKFLTIDPSGTLGNSTVTTDAVIQSAISDYYDNNKNGGSEYSIQSRILSAIRKNQVVTTSGACTLIYIDIANWCLDTVVASGVTPNPSNNVYYNWQPGDRVRFWAATNSDFTGPFIQYDVEIIEYTGTAVIVSKPSDLKFMGTRAQVDASAHFSTKLFNVEVYRPKKFDSNNPLIFYEMGEWYPVVQPGTNSRDFSKKDWTWTNAAAVTSTTINGFTYYNNLPITNGDVWLVTKNFFYNKQSNTTLWNSVLQGFLGDYTITSWANVKGYPVFPQMTQDRNNAAGTWEHNVGRPLAAYEYLPVQFEKSTQVRFGGKFLEDSIFIGINNFQDDNQKIYPSEYGKIRAMVNTSNTQVKDVGQILMVICEEETMDVYVNRATLQQLGGQTQVTLSDQVLGSYNTLLGSWGTLNPESISKKNSRVLFWNAKQGRWIRRSVDGLTPISDNKMYNWFNDLSILLIDTYSTNEKPKVISMYDNYYEEWVTFIDHSTLPSTYRGYGSYKCASFNEGNKRWATIYDYSPDIFAALDNETYSIIGTVVHIHYEGNDFGSIYGVKKNCMWQPVANSVFRMTKVWRALNLQATDKWSFPSIDGDYKSNGATAQNTALLLADLQNREGTWWADIKRDLNTANAPSSDQAIVNGDPMRSRALTLMLKLDPSVTWYSFINWLVVTFDPSEKTVKK